MAPLLRVVAATALLLLAGGPAAAASQCDDKKPTSSPVTAPGVAYKVLLNDLARPRGVVTDAQGNLLVVEQGGKGVRRVVLDDGAGVDVCVKESAQLIDESTLNHGIALSGDGKTLFASSSTDVYAYSYDAAKGTAGTGKKVITGMDQGGHATRTLLIPKHNPNLLVVSRGSDGNIDTDTTNIGSARSQLRIFEVDKLLEGNAAVEYASGKVLGWGLRNSVGVAEDPTTGYIWSVENSIDNMKRGGDDIHNSNPGEELNFHGLPNDTSSDVYGKNYGYPACVAIYDSSNVKDYPGGAVTGKQMVGDQMPSNYTDDFCQKETVSPYVTFGSHLAPLDIEFQDDGSAAYIAMHGSWNRQPPNGYRLSRVSYSKGFPARPKDSQDAEERIMWNADNAECPGSCFRPVGLALGEGGRRLYMTSDATGELYAVTGFQACGYGGMRVQVFYRWGVSARTDETRIEYCDGAV
ncbi:hypothetical protein PLICBS_000900 [Purpureocillium lilacinum]|uniref:uncharacterized protein n=1 Tax=Purpureocillium lilacinum TaxID=33203 RepID=UPI00207FDFAC|nr:hypothetical protein PLICBS_000900 [Purpureocillium lilacinum]